MEKNGWLEYMRRRTEEVLEDDHQLFQITGVDEYRKGWSVLKATGIGHTKKSYPSKITKI